MMDEDDEIQSPSPPHQNGRLSLQSQPVTVAEAPPQNILTLALPIQQPRPQSGHGGSGGGGGGGGGREDCWSDGATSTLIDAWGERYMELSRGNLKQKHWQDVADIVSSREDYRKPPKTDVQCKNRIDTLKKKYKVEKSKILSGQGPSQWAFFHRLDRLIGANTKITAGITSMANAMVTATPATPAIVSKVPVAIPVTGIRTFYNKPPPQQQQRKPSQFQTHGFMQQQSNSSGSEAEVSPESSDSLPPETTFSNRKRPRMERELNSEPPAAKPKAASASASGKSVGKGSGWGNSIRELTQAIMEFGESYERAETSKLQQVVEMEKQRMGFAKELELQRMQFFMKTQLELTQLKHGRGVGTSHHHHSNNRNNSD